MLSYGDWIDRGDRSAVEGGIRFLSWDSQILKMGRQMFFILLQSSSLWALNDAHYVDFECFLRNSHEILSLLQ